MITEADWNNWRADDIRPYLDAVVEEFGMKRVMYGSDWPVCLVAGSYNDVLGLVKDHFASFSVAEQKMFFAENAIRFYNLREA
jgi:L-fuconolactonase